MIAKSILAGVALLAIPLIAMFGLVVIAGGAASASGARAGQATFNPSDEAIADIAAPLLDLYTRAATECSGLPWQVLAAIAKVESDHGRYGGSTLAADGRVTPPIIGIALDGTNGTASIPDTDGGVFDGDQIWDRAVGPFQFIPSSWAIYGQDGNHDGRRDPHNMLDAVPAAVAHLCPTGTLSDVEDAIYAYNHSHAYVDAVLDWAARYTGPLASTGLVVQGYALPLPTTAATATTVVQAHHDYAALDIATPVGTPVYAMTSGVATAAIGDLGRYVPDTGGRCGNTIVVSGIDNATYTYCHLSAVFVAPGQPVVAGEWIGLSGGQPGMPGAGNTTGPHLHLSVRAYGQSVCPQPIVLAILLGRPIPPTAAPLSGCVQGRPATNWTTWLTAITPPTQGATP